MSFSISRWLLIFSVVGLFLVWVFSAAFYSTGRFRLFIVASGIVFFVILSVLIISFNSLMRSLGHLSASARSAVPVLSFYHPPKSNTNENEIEFVSETFKAVVEQLQIKQRELNELHLKLGERAASAEAFSQYIVSSLPSGLIAFDLQGLIRVINQPAQEIFSLGENSDPIGISYHQLFQSNSDFRQIIFDSLTNNNFVARTEIDYQTPFSTTKRLGTTVAPLEVNSKVAGVLCLVSDITEINQLKEQLALQQNLESLGLMSAGLAHEFKNSLATLHTYAQFLTRLQLGESGHTAVVGLTNEIKNLSQMITAFLEFSRPQSPNLVNLSLKDIFINSINEVKVLLGDDTVKFALAGDFATLCGDLVMLQQVANNLIYNALEAVRANDNPENLISITANLEFDGSGEQWNRIDVEDSGAGIKSTDLPFIFIPFFTTKRHGHGVGLALAHRIITQHNGTLTAANSLKGGAIFTLRLKAQFSIKN